MRAKELLKKYPEQWATIEATVWDDMNYQIKRAKIGDSRDFGKCRRVIAYNAAFIGVSLIHETTKAARKTTASNKCKLAPVQAQSRKCRKTGTSAC